MNPTPLEESSVGQAMNFTYRRPIDCYAIQCADSRNRRSLRWHMTIEIARTYVYRVCRMADDGTAFLKEAAMAKL